jgi:hypothetical protein
LASDGANRWYTIDGTSQNTYTISTLTNPISISTQSIFTSSATVSTLGFEDRNFNTVSSLYTRSTLLFLGSNIIGGSKCGPTLFVPIRRPFLPNQISGLGLWLDAADVNTIRVVNNQVLQWSDKSGNNRNASGGISPSYAPNAIVFNGTTHYLETTYSASLQNETVIMVTFLNTSSYANFPSMLNANGNGGRQLFIYNNGGFQVNVQAVANGPNTGANTAPVLQNVVYSYTCSSGANNTINMFINGTQGVTNGTQSAYTAGLVTWLGKWPGGNHWQGNLCEIISYSNVLTTLQRQQVEGYLAWKWGVVRSLPATHPYKTAPP